MSQKFRLTPQAAGAVMMAMQKGIKAASEGRPKEECDITSMLLKFELEATTSGLIVNNPPILQYDEVQETSEENLN